MRTKAELLYLQLEDSRLRWAANSAGIMMCRGFSNPPDVLTHWALSFERGGSVQLVDGVRDANGDLVFICRFKNKKQLEKIEPMVRRRVDLGDYQWTHQRVTNAISRIPELGKYRVLSNNCQSASMRLLNQLGIAVPQDVVTVHAEVQQLGQLAGKCVEACVVCTADLLTKLSS